MTRGTAEHRFSVAEELIRAQDVARELALAGRALTDQETGRVRAANELWTRVRAQRVADARPTLPPPTDRNPLR